MGPMGYPSEEGYPVLHIQGVAKTMLSPRFTQDLANTQTLASKAQAELGRAMNEYADQPNQSYG
jgi:hypothetical protein